MLRPIKSEKIMAKYNKIQVITTFQQTGIVPVFFNKDAEVAKKVVKACYDGGIRAFEFTNRGDFAIDVFREVSKYVLAECPGLILGAGTVIDAPTAALYIQYGANFIVSPNINPEVAKICNRHGIPYTPGCGSVTEIGNAQELGCDVVKVFPAGSVGGPAFVKDILGPLPWSLVMATGSVSPTEENLSAWAKSGVLCVGMGSKLFPKDKVAAGDWQGISAICAASIGYFQAAKK